MAAPVRILPAPHGTPPRESHLNPTSTKTTKPASEQLRSVQCLRAIAALFVVGFHATLLLHDNFWPGAKPWDNGNAGVDLFFVISGFINDGFIPAACRPGRRLAPLHRAPPGAYRAHVLAGDHGPACRLQRCPRSRGAHFPTTWNTIASFLFLPSADRAGFVEPVLAVGWTLSFEMLFYVVFAAALLRA